MRRFKWLADRKKISNAEKEERFCIALTCKCQLLNVVRIKCSMMCRKKIDMHEFRISIIQCKKKISSKATNGREKTTTFCDSNTE